MGAPEALVENEPLAPLTTFGIGGPARWFAQLKTVDEARRAVAFAALRKLRVHIIGGGSNLLVADGGVDGLVLRLDGTDEFGRIEPEFSDPPVWRVGAAVPLPRLVGETIRRGVAGLEEFSGLPGTVGGAAAMNAGGATSGFGDLVAAALVIDADGEVRRLTGGELSFAYRRSSLAGSLAIGFELRFPGMIAPEDLILKAARARERKAERQPLDKRSAGCIFKNPSGVSAGKLLDDAGCKGMRAGGAEVSEVHANFIVNAGGAGARDVATLAAAMHGRVRERLGVELEPEVKCWGFELRDTFD